MRGANEVLHSQHVSHRDSSSPPPGTFCPYSGVHVSVLCLHEGLSCLLCIFHTQKDQGHGLIWLLCFPEVFDIIHSHLWIPTKKDALYQTGLKEDII